MGLECDLYCSGFLCALESGDGLGSIRQVDMHSFLYSSFSCCFRSTQAFPRTSKDMNIGNPSVLLFISFLLAMF